MLKRSSITEIKRTSISDIKRGSLGDTLAFGYTATDPCSTVEETKYEIKTDRCGLITVYVQGNAANVTETTPVFLTVHDMGGNHADFHQFIEHPSMRRVKGRSVFLHVEVPGQENDAPDMPEGGHYPSMQDVAEDLISVVNYFHIKCVVTLGEGAGANILARFAMGHPERVFGNILIHCTSTVAGVMEYFSDKLMNWKLQNVGMNPTAEQYLVLHKFGPSLLEQIERAENKEKLIHDYAAKLTRRINPRNLRFYVEAFLNRTDLSTGLVEKMKVDTLLVTGARASHVHTVHTMHSNMDPKRTTLLKIDDVGDVMQEAPDVLAHNLILFCQGLGLLSALPMSRQASISS